MGRARLLTRPRESRSAILSAMGPARDTSAEADERYFEMLRARTPAERGS